MMASIRRRSGRLGLGARIALTMFAAMMAIQILNAAVFFLMPRPDLKLYSTRWLTSETRRIVRALTNAPFDKAQRLIDQFNADTGLDMRAVSLTDLGYTRRHAFEPLQRLEDTLSTSLSSDVKFVEVHGRIGPPGSRPRDAPSNVQSVPPGALLSAAEPDLQIRGRFDIELEFKDNRRFRISAIPWMASWVLSWPALLTLGGAVALITLFSAWTARRTLEPLDELVVAARRLGVERTPTPIATENLRDFATIGEAMNEMQARICDFVDERTQILAAISHDLRTALTRMRIDTEAIIDPVLKQRFASAVDEMEGMISATLTFAADDLKGETSEPLDVASLLITIADNFQDLGCEVLYEGPDHARLVAQPIGLRRAITNLVDNAVKYGEAAKISLLPSAFGVTIEISDRGPGIPQELIGIVVQPFRRLEQSRNRGTGGVGLGLTIARDIVRAHGGSLDLANAADGGLVVTVRLPAS